MTGLPVENWRPNTAEILAVVQKDAQIEKSKDPFKPLLVVCTGYAPGSPTWSFPDPPHRPRPPPPPSHPTRPPHAARSGAPGSGCWRWRPLQRRWSPPPETPAVAAPRAPREGGCLQIRWQWPQEPQRGMPRTPVRQLQYRHGLHILMVDHYLCGSGTCFCWCGGRTDCLRCRQWREAPFPLPFSPFLGAADI